MDELLEVGQAKSKTEAVINAIKNEINQKKKENIKNLAGQAHFSAEADELRHGDTRLG
jgi:uncharacterized protein YdbL (DUF1318 family)